jgi:hypothetical protein
MKKQENQKATLRGVLILVSLVVCTLAMVLIYRATTRFSIFPYVLGAYMFSATVFVLSFLLYNRGLSRRGVTPDMLPDEWSDDEKNEFIEDGKRRLKKSRWMLIPILAFVVTFAVDLIELFVVPFFTNVMKG